MPRREPRPIRVSHDVSNEHLLATRRRVRLDASLRADQVQCVAHLIATVVKSQLSSLAADLDSVEVSSLALEAMDRDRLDV